MVCSVRFINVSFNSLCEIQPNRPDYERQVSRLSILYVRFKYVLVHYLNLSYIILSILYVRFLWQLVIDPNGDMMTFNSLCEIPTPFLAPFIGLKGDLSLSKRGCAATPQLASGYIKG